MPRGFNRAYLERLKHQVPLSFIVPQVEPYDREIDMYRGSDFGAYPYRKKKRTVLRPTLKHHRCDYRWIGCSPFSNEKSPSFTVNDKLMFYKCFSTQRGGDIFTFLGYVAQMPFPVAVSFVRELSAQTSVRERKPRHKKRKPRKRNRKRADQ